MTLHSRRTQDYLRTFDFKSLFIEELLWDDFIGSTAVMVGQQAIPVERVAQKRGVGIFHCQLPELPDRPTRQKIERALTKQAAEHLIIFSETAQTTQVWQWVKREPGQPDAYREHTYHVGHNDAALIDKLKGVVFDIGEEEGVTLTDVTVRLRDAFDKDKVSKKFFDSFKREHKAFLGFVEGIQKLGDREWYASVMLNRLMFIYFIQKKGFLDGDRDYLQNRLKRTRERKDPFYTFYRAFLLRLFHDGLGGRERGTDLEALIGRVPYLNGGLFDVHELERDYPDIRIPDEAFGRVFDFFDEYDWYLDDRPMRKEREINPDVIGYIFEKYINQKQMGAYYTKEDITEYIGKNTILPFVLESAQKGCKVAFEGESSVWRLLQDDPDRYIYPAVKKGTGLDLPPNIAAGIDDVSQRGDWNTPADDAYALPTEIWREVVARRERYFETKEKMQRGEVRSAGDLITLNLDIRQFVQDVIEGAEGPELVRAVYYTLAGRVPKPGTHANYRSGLSVLDPTCGSGAFLFAALNILKPLYEACLERMESFVEDAERGGAPGKRYADFKDILEDAQSHPNRDYFVLKTIILNNLYGVDIMPEAVEIAKLRLFLKLAAQVEPNGSRKNYGVEPLPDIDFNIRAGNTLVGYASYDEVQQAVEGKWGKNQLIKLDLFNAVDVVKEKASAVSRLFRLFRQQQMMGGTDDEDTTEDTVDTKKELRERLKVLREELDAHLAREYGIDPAKPAEYRKWLESHEPFHWYTEFYEMMSEEGNGGFDVTIGNPPYVEYSKIRKQYSVNGYSTVGCGNIYTLVLERSKVLLREQGYWGFIVPLSLVCTDRMVDARAQLAGMASWASCYDMRPSSLFEGVAQRLCILISQKLLRHTQLIQSGGYRRWSSSERLHLLENTSYVNVSDNFPEDGPIPKVVTPTEIKVLKKIEGPPINALVDAHAKPFYVHRIARYFIKALDFVPLFIDATGSLGKSEDYKPFRLRESEQSVAIALLNSSLFYWFWRGHSDGFHCGYGDVYRMPYAPVTNHQLCARLVQLHKELMDTLQQTSREKTITTKKGVIQYQEFHPASAKPITDEIDRILAQHYSFTNEELDFIINYDIKYRMGDALLEED